MTIFQSILLGIVQGLTEFLPISSSGHLVIVPYLLGWEIPVKDAFVFGVLVQVATLVAVIAYFWRDLVMMIKGFYNGIKTKKPLEDSQSRLAIWIIIATIPAGVFGLLVKDIVEAAFSNARVTAILMFVTAILLVIAERVGARRRNLEDMDWKDALWIGFFQALAIFPGVSRSGATITGGMTRDLQREPAARFSFLISIPVMLAAGFLALLDLFKIPNPLDSLLVYIPGFIAAAVVGYLTIRWLLRYLTHHPLYVFAIYCAVVGTLTLILSLFI